jgi:hypothetical protein
MRFVKLRPRGLTQIKIPTAFGMMAIPGFRMVYSHLLTLAQMSYGLPSSTQVSQIQDPGAQSRSSQQATMQSLGMVNQPGTPV